MLRPLLLLLGLGEGQLAVAVFVEVRGGRGERRKHGLAAPRGGDQQAAFVNHWHAHRAMGREKRDEAFPFGGGEKDAAARHHGRGSPEGHAGLPGEILRRPEFRR
ncbi:MAG: hypothetical protein HXY18_14400 [Bryobacteraceae bacterium]|nr:hypothetical protein [Bryobacteraceae bacterium]